MLQCGTKFAKKLSDLEAEHTDDDAVQEAFRILNSFDIPPCAVAFLQKPFDDHEIIELIRSTLSQVKNQN